MRRRPTASRDLERFRAGYPGIVDNPNLKANLQFYRNLLPSRPDGDVIDEILSRWRGNYEVLERHHGYIQWLFPIRDPTSMNHAAQPLQQHEAAIIARERGCRERFVGAFSMMLDFLGFALVRTEDGLDTVAVAADIDHVRTRFTNFIRHVHNDLRVTRILKSLCEMGFPRLQLLFLRALGHEIFSTQRLKDKHRSFQDYWAETVKDDRARHAVQQLASMKPLGARGHGVHYSGGEGVRFVHELTRKHDRQSADAAGDHDDVNAAKRKRHVVSDDRLLLQLHQTLRADSRSEEFAALAAEAVGAAMLEAANLRQALDEAQALSDRAQSSHPIVLLFVVPLEAASREAAAARLSDALAAAGHDATAVHVYLVADGWLPAAAEAPHRAPTLLRDYVTLRVPAFGGTALHSGAVHHWPF